MKIKKILICLVTISFLLCITGCPPPPRHRLQRPRRPIASNHIIPVQPAESPTIEISERI